MPLSEVELNAALRAQLEARRLSHRGLMALGLFLTLLLLVVSLLWFQFAPPSWLPPGSTRAHPIIDYVAPTLILLVLLSALRMAWSHGQACAGIGRSLKAGRAPLAQGALAGMRPQAGDKPLSAAPVAPARPGDRLRWSGTRVDYVLDGKPAPGRLDPPDPDAIWRHEVMDLYTLHPDAQARVSYAYGDRIARVDYPALPPVASHDAPMAPEDWAGVRRDALKRLAWVPLTFLIVMAIPLALGAFTGILHLAAYQAMLWFLVALFLVISVPLYVRPIRQLWFWWRRSRLQASKRTLRGPITEVLVTVRTISRAAEYARWVRVDGRWYQEAQIAPLRFDDRRLHATGDAELNFLVVDGRVRFALTHHCPLAIGPTRAAAQPA
ncbi:hypothetical protein [Achromobacter insuavis]|uniref:hypothetical protein n=1 Tax=Achromobacter insuavis TaxID=1287735 RepID=UPI001F13B43A|nr:hypothetical protein [Achromobacter insuavis]